MKKLISLSLALLLCVCCGMCMPVDTRAVTAEENAPFDVAAESAVLMEAGTGKVLYAKNANEALPPASVTKVMTLLLVMEAID